MNDFFVIMFLIYSPNGFFFTYLYSVCYCVLRYVPEMYDCPLAMHIQHTEIAV